MIRRGFWLTAGAVAGVYGYRRVSAVGRRLSATLSLTDAAAPARVTRQVNRQSARRGAIAMARETYRFTRDVREGMELYKLSHPAQPGSTLSTDHVTDRNVQAEDDR